MLKVSIILPVYNVEKYISKSIQSVLDQTYTNFELLVIDDGSPDKSIEIAKKFKDERIFIHQKENGGLSDARNFGLERAQGEYVYFMDSDDWIEADLLEDNLKILESENLDLLVFGYIQDDENIKGVVFNSTTVVPESNIYEKENDKLIIDNQLLGLLGYAWNKIYRKDFLDKHALLFEKGTSLVEDILFNTQVYCKTEILRTVDKAYYHYLNRPVGTLIKKFHPDSFELKKRKTQNLKTFFEEWRVKDKESILAYSTIQGIRYCIHNLFSFENQLTFLEKVEYIKTMLNEPITREYVKYYKTESLKNKLYKILIQNKQAYLIAQIAKLIK